MKVLWLTNTLLPDAARALGLEKTNKEGWLVGLLDSVKKSDADVTFGVASPVMATRDGFKAKIDSVTYYGFYEDTFHPENYDAGLDGRLSKIIDDFKPDIVHIFGTEFPHTLAMTRAFNKPEKILISIQGVCGEIAKHYADGVPKKVVKRATFRDIVRKDAVFSQIEKFSQRGANEKEALRGVMRVAGRTSFDRDFVMSVNPSIDYYYMNETLKADFYKDYEKCEKIPHSIFISQADYPVKGAHYLFKAAGILLKEYKDLTIKIAGNPITRHSNIKEILKLPSYGMYLLELIKKNGLEGHVEFTGNVSVEKMIELYREASVFVCCSTIENSPNCVGEAMLLNTPVVAADVGGVSSVMDESDGIIYEAGNVTELAKAIKRIWDDKEFADSIVAHGRERALNNHDASTNLERLLEIYGDICK